MSVHDLAVVHPSAQLGKNVNVGPFTTIRAGAEIGDDVQIGPNVLIEPGCVIEKNCQIHHGASLGGDPQIADFKDVSSGVHIGEGTVVREYVTIHRSHLENGQTRVGPHCLLMAYVHIAHDCDLGREVIVVNSAGLSGHVVAEDYAFISGMVGVHQFTRIGKHCMIGGGLILRQDVLPYSLIKGPPARLYTANVVGLKRRGFSESAVSGLRKAFKFLKQPDLNATQAVEKLQAEVEMTEEIRYLVDFIGASKRGIIK